MVRIPDVCVAMTWEAKARLGLIWNSDRLYEIMAFGTYQYVPVCTEYILVRNAENGTYQYVLVGTQYVQVL